MLGASVRCHIGLANSAAELIKLPLCANQLAIDNLQTHDERVDVNTGCLRNSICNFDGGLSQYSKNTLSIYAADAMLLEQLSDD
jgi:hypothetical protein